MADTRILRFRRRAPDGSTTPLLSPRQAEQISEAMLAEERRTHAGARRALRWHWDYGVKSLARVEPPQRRAAIVREAMRNVNNGWTKALVLLVPIAAFAAIEAFGSPRIAGDLEIALVIGLGLPGLVVHTRLMRREIEALVARELDRDRAGL